MVNLWLQAARDVEQHTEGKAASSSPAEAQRQSGAGGGAPSGSTALQSNLPSGTGSWCPLRQCRPKRPPAQATGTPACRTQCKQQHSASRSITPYLCLARHHRLVRVVLMLYAELPQLGEQALLIHVRPRDTFEKGEGMRELAIGGQLKSGHVQLPPGGTPLKRCRANNLATLSALFIVNR